MDHIEINVAPSAGAPPERFAAALHPREDSLSPAFSALYAGLQLTNAVPKIHDAEAFGLGNPDIHMVDKPKLTRRSPCQLCTVRRDQAGNDVIVALFCDFCF